MDPIATGAALASVLRNDGRVAVAFFGDGAVKRGQPGTDIYKNVEGSGIPGASQVLFMLFRKYN